VTPISRRAWRLAPLLVLLLGIWLSACAPAARPDKTLTLAVIFPASGADAAVGAAMQRAVALAVTQNASLPNGYTLTLTTIDEASLPGDEAASSLAADSHVMGIVGPFDSQTAAAMLPVVEQNGITTISPTATLPGLTQSGQATTEGLTFAQLHPTGKPNVFFRAPQTDNAAGKVAADLAVAPASAHGLAAHTIFIVDDSTPSGKALAAAFKQELVVKHGAVAGQKSLTADPQDNAQTIVSAIVEAAPDAVFFAGGIAPGADLRSTLTLTGVPQLPILTVGPIAGDPTWSATVGVVPAAAYTSAILPAPDLSTIASAKTFTSAYQSAYPNQDLLPQSAIAYDAAMDEITAIKALLTGGQPVTRAAVRAAVAATKYPGITGTFAFDVNGDNTTALAYSLYTCDLKGTWHYQTHL